LAILGIAKNHSTPGLKPDPSKPVVPIPSCQT
jgi:hypothetical protein